LIHQRAIVVVGAVLLILGLLAAFSWLYDVRVFLTDVEHRWISSQRSSSTAVTEPPLGVDTVVTLRRTECYGFCPAYEVSIFGSGRVEFHGEAYVCEQAPAVATVDQSSVRQLVDGMLSVGFMQMPSYVHYVMSDAPTAIVTLRQGDSMHTVAHYHGDPQAPRLVSWIEDRIDEVARTSARLPVADGLRLVCVAPDGSRETIAAWGEGP